MISFTNIEALRPGDEIVMSWSMYPPAGESPDGWSWAIVTCTCGNATNGQREATGADLRGQQGSGEGTGADGGAEA